MVLFGAIKYLMVGILCIVLGLATWKKHRLSLVHSVNYSERMRHPDPGIGTKPVLIRQGAFIGAHSIILKGVTIGRHSVIGAGSVVTHDVPDNEIWAGNPAVFVRRIN